MQSHNTSCPGSILNTKSLTQHCYIYVGMLCEQFCDIDLGEIFEGLHLTDSVENIVRGLSK